MSLALPSSVHNLGMSPSKIYEPHEAVATIAYWLERSDGSRPTAVEETLKILRQGKEVDARETTIHDIRNIEGSFTLDTNGFQLWNIPEMPEYINDDAEIEAKEYPTIVEKLKEM
jgi:hypothetical protein